MAGGDQAVSPLETVADLAGGEVIKAFELLSNETRLAILLALWEANDPGLPMDEAMEPTISFSELRERVGVRDSGQFNYHLDKLVGTFLMQTAEGYSLTDPAEQILHAVFAGMLTHHASFEGEPVAASCYQCGEPAVVDYEEGVLVKRCVNCEGNFQSPDTARDGMLGKEYRPPAGLVDRTPQEFYTHGRTWTRHRMHSMMEKVCPDCSGSVTTTIHVCDDHDPDTDVACGACGSSWRATAILVCDVFKFAWIMPAFTPMITEQAVKTFYYERGLDIDATYDSGDSTEFFEAIEDVTVTDAPLEVVTTVELDGDRLTVTLDDEATVVDVTEEPRGTD